MPDLERIQRGRDFEVRVAEATGGQCQPGSGNGWRHKSDVKSGGMLLISAKAETDRTWARTRAQMREAIDLAAATGMLPALALLEDDGEEIIVMRLSDLALALSGEVALQPQRSNGEVRRERADIPVMLRSET